MSILSRMFRKKKQGPFDELIDRIENDEEDGLFISGDEEALDPEQRPEPLPTREAAPPSDGEALELPELEQAVAEEQEAEAAAEGTAEDQPAPEVGEREDTAAAEAAPTEAKEEEPPAPEAEVQTAAAADGGGDDALSMFRATGASSDLLELTKDIEDSAAQDVLRDAQEVRQMLTGGGA